MQKSGIASNDQAKESQQAGVLSWKGVARTDGHDIGKSTEGSEVELARLDLLSSGGQADGNGSRVRRGQADDTDTGEGVEGGVRSEVEETEKDLDDHAEHHGIQGNIELLVDDTPPLGAGDGAITSKGPSATRSSGSATDTAHDGEDHDGDEEADGTA